MKMKKIKEQFTEGWKFHLGNIEVLHPVKSGMAGGLTSSKDVEEGEWLKIAYFDECKIEEPDESQWESVDIPHDWCVEGNYRNDFGKVKHHKSHGYLDGGVGFYRKTFQIKEEWLGRRIGLEFEGVFRNCTVWVNGFEIVHYESGYTGFWCELTDVLRYGREGNNVILVRVDARDYEGWWYEGAGIYRKVWLEVKEPLHIDRNGIFVATPEVKKESAVVRAKVRVFNENYEKQVYILRNEILSPDGLVLGCQEENLMVEGKECFESQWESSVHMPQLWSPENPALYQLVTRVIWNGEETETVVTEFGIKTAEFDAKRGFLLNGEPYLLKGTCNHQDFAGVGVALPDSLIEYKLKKLKEMGCNAYRSAHHPAAKKVLEICDHMGMLVVNENRKLDSTEKGIQELKELICSSRNHACIFIWSLENEEILEGTVMGERILRTLADISHKLDPYRPVTAAMNHGWNDGGYSDVVDVVGYNYGQREGQDVNDHVLFPDRKSMGSESASYTLTRGEYENNPEKGYCSEYGTNIPEWSCSVEKAWTDVLAHPELSGVFIWTGFDYRGEPTPYEWPNINSHFGVMDTCGFPKSSYHYLRAQWTQEPVLFLMPHWNWEGEEGIEKKVRIETNCEKVELILNGNSLGEKVCEKAGHIEWDVPYQPGKLEAVGYREENEIIHRSVYTAKSPECIELLSEKQKCTANGEDTICVGVSLMDGEGHFAATEDRKIKFRIEGPAVILGVGNGDPSCHEPDKAEERTTFHGKCMVILQAKKEPGNIVLHAASENLKAAAIELYSEK